MVRTAIRACQGEKPHGTRSSVAAPTASHVRTASQVRKRETITARTARTAARAPPPVGQNAVWAGATDLFEAGHLRMRIVPARPRPTLYLYMCPIRSHGAAARGTTLTCFAAFDYVPGPTLLRQRSRDAGEATR
jgi:hypothetical protein